MSFARPEGEHSSRVRLPRYSLGARFYDGRSGERPVYRAGRLRGIAALHLSPGARVLDVGCGTGLNLAPVLSRIGPAGRVLGVDRSDAMLAQARALGGRCQTVVRGWPLMLQRR